MAELKKADKPRNGPRARFDASLWVRCLKQAVLPAAAFAGYRTYRLGGEIVSVILALAITALYLASNLAARQSMDLNAMRPNAERWFSQTFEGARADLGELSIRWNPSEDTVVMTATDIVVYDTESRIVQTLPLLRLSTTKASLLALQPRLRDIEIVGGEISWVVRDDGRVIAGIGRPETVGGIGPTFEGRADRGDQALTEWLSEFQSISLRESRGFIQNRQSGLDAVIELDRLYGRKDAALTILDVDGAVMSGNERGQMRLAMQSLDDMQTYDLDLTLQGLVPESLSTRAGRLSALKGLALPVDARLTARYGRETGLEAASLALSAGQGSVDLAGDTHRVNALNFDAVLNPGDEEMQVEALRIDSERLVLSGEGVIREIGRLYDGDVGTSPKFDLAMRDAWLDLTPFLPAPLRMDRAMAVGEIDVDARRLTFDQLTVDFGDFGLTTTLNVVSGEDGLSSLTLSGQTQTAMNVQHLLSLWPTDAASGARRWIDRSILDGRLDDVVFDVALDEVFFTDPTIDSGAFELTFRVTDGVARYISTMTPITGVSGTGRIEGANFGFVLEGGTIGEIDIVGGDVSIPRLERGGDIFVTAQGRGPVPALLDLINQPPFEYLDRYGVQADGFSGSADVTLNIQRPLLEFFDQDRIQYSVDGKFTDTTAPFTFGPYGLTDADVTVTGGKEGLFVNGLVNLGPWRANLNWEERYGQNDEPTRYRITGPMTRKAMDGFGLGFREYFGGEIDVDIEATGRGLDLEGSFVDIDMTQAEIAFGDVWSKPAGEAGRFRATIARQDSMLMIDNARMEAPGLTLSGKGRLQQDLVLEELNLDRLAVQGLVDGRATLTRDIDNARLALDAEGQILDLSQWVDAALSADRQDESELPIAVDARFETIRLAPDYAVQQAVLAYRHDGVAIERMDLNGTRPDGPFEISLANTDDATARFATLRIPDLSLAASNLLGLATFSGGDLVIDARLPMAGDIGPTLGTVRATDFTVRDAPFLAQILSLASLTGIVDTLSGTGLGFDELVFDFAMQDRNLSVRDAKMRGPAIGMTGEGEVKLNDRLIDFSGTLVPAYTANSFLGDIPLLGDLLVGQDGEGIFAVTYAVRGPFSGAQIAINPLSALTPGFIRGIFRESRDDLPESVVEEIESVRPETTD